MHSASVKSQVQIGKLCYLRNRILHFVLVSALQKISPWPPPQYISVYLYPLLFSNPYFFKFADTSSNLLLIGRPLRLCNIFTVILGIRSSSILPTSPNHRILCNLMNLTMSLPCVSSYNSALRRNFQDISYVHKFSA